MWLDSFMVVSVNLSKAFLNIYFTKLIFHEIFQPTAVAVNPHYRCLDPFPIRKGFVTLIECGAGGFMFRISPAAQSYRILFYVPSEVLETLRFWDLCLEY